MAKRSKRSKEQYRAEYLARVAREQAVGYRSYRHARDQRAAGRPLPRDVGRARRAPVRIDTPGGRVVKTANRREVLRAVGNAAGRDLAASRTSRRGNRPMGDVQVITSGRNVSILATYDTAGGPRSRRIEISARRLAMLIEEAGGDIFEVLHDLWDELYG